MMNGPGLGEMLHISTLEVLYYYSAPQYLGTWVPSIPSAALNGVQVRHTPSHPYLATYRNPSPCFFHRSASSFSLLPRFLCHFLVISVLVYYMTYSPAYALNSFCVPSSEIHHQIRRNYLSPARSHSSNRDRYFRILLSLN